MSRTESSITGDQLARLLVLVGSVSIMVVNGTVVAVLLPVIIGDLGLTNTQAEWANSAFALFFATSGKYPLDPRANVVHQAVHDGHDDQGQQCRR